MAREKKPKPIPVSKLYPGTEAVALAMGWSVEVVRQLAAMAGCPLVRGGKGRRFTSVEAFRAWFEALPGRQKRSVPEIDRAQRLKVAEEVGRLTWTVGDTNYLARKHTYAELCGMRDHWKDTDEADKGEQAAKDVLARRRA